jgi:hypothetical protein
MINKLRTIYLHQNINQKMYFNLIFQSVQCSKLFGLSINHSKIILRFFTFKCELINELINVSSNNHKKSSFLYNRN